MNRTIIVTLFCVLCSISISAQGTEFSYQGSLKDGANPANGNYDFEFLLFDALTAGTQQGATLTRSAVAVANGIFSVKLDFGSQFPGANRFLEIRVRLAGQPGITTLTPRQLVNSAPYSVKSLNTDTATNASQLGGVAASQYVVTTDPRMTDARPPTAGSSFYIRNQTAPQTADFNIAGSGMLSGNLAVGGTLSATFGQIGNTAYGTAQVQIGPATVSYVLIPGLTQTVDVPSNSVVYVATDGGIQNTSASSTSYAAVDLGIFIDGAISTQAGQRRIMIPNTAAATQMIANWSIAKTLTLPTGIHTIEVKAAGADPGAVNANVSSSGAPQLQGQLTVMILKR